MRVRQKAQFELAERGDKGLEVFKAAIAQTDDRLARIHGIWGVSQLAREDDRHASLLLPLLKDEDAEIRAQAAKWLGDMRFEEASQELVPLLLRSEEHTSELQSLMRISYAVFCLKKKKIKMTCI